MKVETDTTVIKNSSKPKIETRKSKSPEKGNAKLINLTMDDLSDDIKKVILEKLSSRSLVQLTLKVVPKSITNYLIHSEFPKDKYLLPILRKWQKRIENGDYDDVDSRNIARLERRDTQKKYLDSIHEAAEKEIQTLDIHLKNETQSTLDDIYEGEKEKEKEQKGESTPTTVTQ